jgi:glucose-1-phosphate thymidylyltransferase
VGGTGSRMQPMSLAVSKHLLAVYDKPMVYYSLSILMLANIREILIITNGQDLAQYEALLGDGSRFGIKLTYAIQSHPEGIAQSLIIGESFLGDSSVCLVLGDNILYGQGLSAKLQQASMLTVGAKIFGYPVSNPNQFGVVELDDSYRPISITEKPAEPRGNLAVPGIYFYDNQASGIAKGIEKSGRGEFEITSINEWYLGNKQLEVDVLGRGYAWLDTGTPEALLEAGQFVATIEKRQGTKIACLEEIAVNNGWLSIKHVEKVASTYQSTYGEYLKWFIKSYGLNKKRN